MTKKEKKIKDAEKIKKDTERLKRNIERDKKRKELELLKLEKEKENAIKKENELRDINIAKLALKYIDDKTTIEKYLKSLDEIDF